MASLLLSLPNGEFSLSFGTRPVRPDSAAAFFGEPLFFDESFGGHFEAQETSYFCDSGGLRDFLIRKKLLPKVYVHRGSVLGGVLARLKEPTFADFETDFTQIAGRLKSGEMSKVVPAIFERTELSTAEAEVMDPLLLECFLSFFENLSAEFKSKLFLYAFWDEKRFHVGLSPEYLFFKEKNASLLTMALAGSAPLTCDDAPFSTDPKELSEHALVVEDIRQKCQQMGVSHISTSALTVLKLPTIKHLFTRIEIADFKNNEKRIAAVSDKKMSSRDLRDLGALPKSACENHEGALKNEDRPFDAWSWLKALHPTSALGVKPATLENKKFFKALRSSGLRGVLGSPLTLSDPGCGRHFSVVGIRGVERRGKEFFLGAGCGVVRASDPVKEWQELSLKRQSVKKILSAHLSQGSRS